MKKLFTYIPAVMIGCKDEATLNELLNIAKKNKLEILDIFSSYAITNVENHVSIKKFNPGFVTFYSGLAGLLISILVLPFFQQNYPLNFGTKPSLPLLSFVPVAFVLIILFSSLGVAGYWLIHENLLPGQKNKVYLNDTDAICLLIRTNGNREKISQIFESVPDINFSEESYIRQEIALPIPVKFDWNKSK